jgi:1-acyl-sn-glycerol-3-phosphate acyltransferase
MTLPRFWKIGVYNEKGFDIGDFEHKTFILASNHSSIIDTLFMSMMPCKKTYTYNSKWSIVPVFGWLCLWAGYIGIDTKSEASRKTVVGRVVDKVRRGYSVMIYPEGTRTRNPYVIANTIKTGAFRISQESKIPVLPIIFNNTFKAVDRYGIVDIANIDIIIATPLEIKEDLNEYSADFLASIRRHLQKEAKVD